MTNELTEILKRRMALQGPISVSDYMRECLSHPDHGYYQKQDPLGKAGDFTTAPEVSQMFGELLGLWCGVCWKLLSHPHKIHLVELGPGRGTLMSDALRAARNIPEFFDAVNVHLIETSPILREKQAALMNTEPCPITWHDSITTIPDDAPLIILANEFFDALPVRQYVMTDQGWQERCVTWNADQEEFNFIISPAWGLPDNQLPTHPTGSIFEICPLGCQIARDLSARVARQKGAILVIDYGHLESSAGDSFQAVKDHSYHNVLDDPGNADLTAHVDFQALRQALGAGGATVTTGLTQGTFLKRLGILERAQILVQNNPAKAADIVSACNRLIDDDRMGTLFKVVAASSNLQLPGFDAATISE